MTTSSRYGPGFLGVMVGNGLPFPIPDMHGTGQTIPKCWHVGSCQAGRQGNTMQMAQDLRNQDSQFHNLSCLLQIRQCKNHADNAIHWSYTGKSMLQNPNTMISIFIPPPRRPLALFKPVKNPFDVQILLLELLSVRATMAKRLMTLSAFMACSERQDKLEFKLIRS
ncbi:hypothetical protein GOODEAATRI_010534 [Goodea atripinnis]|uniref:Uncharacterized protein n=1 Tax=Goodea atripinnis TaxID=208336 RepID=A0ABV0P584_9TELE